LKSELNKVNKLEVISINHKINLNQIDLLSNENSNNKKSNKTENKENVLEKNIYIKKDTLGEG